MTPTQPAPLDDAGAMAVLDRDAADAENYRRDASSHYADAGVVESTAARDHLARRITDLEKSNEYRLGLLRGINAIADSAQQRATRAVAELANANTTVTELREELASLRVYVAANVERASRAEAELAAVRANAERYVWLRESGWGEIFYRHEDEHHKHDAMSRSASERLDAAVDAARGEGG